MKAVTFPTSAFLQISFEQLKIHKFANVVFFLIENFWSRQVEKMLHLEGSS